MTPRGCDAMGLARVRTDWLAVLDGDQGGSEPMRVSACRWGRQSVDSWVVMKQGVRAC